MENLNRHSSTYLLNNEESNDDIIKKSSSGISFKTLKLKKQVTWSEDTVDNEFMNRKKSKICCIYKKNITHPDQSSSSSCESCDEKGKNAYERPNHYNKNVN